MDTLHDLLLDCRTALRRADPAFAQSTLYARLDATILAMGQGRTPPVDEVRPPETRTGQQVAYAWQMAARDLRFSHPELHAALTERVHQLLDIEVLSDPDTEIQSLQARVDTAAAAAQAAGLADQSLHARLDTALAAAQAAELELADLHRALAEAVPSINDPKIPPPEAARLRMRALLDGSKGKVNAGAASTAPTRESLQAVVEGRRTLTRDERDWCMSEAMVLSGFQQTPLQLLAQGEAELARMILAAQSS